MLRPDDPDDPDDPEVPATPRPRPARTAVLVAAGVLLALVVGVLVGRALPTSPGGQSVDVGFARDMSTHHAQAVAMAYAAIQTAPSPEVRQLAVDIASTQGNQAGRLQELLLTWDQPIASTAPVMEWMRGTDAHAQHLVQQQQGRTMPGMATPAEMARLQSQTGEVFEVDVLQLLLRHHEGGIEMAEVGAERATTAQVRDLASAIAASQRSESQVLAQMLAERGAQPLPAPSPAPTG